jgi:phospholipid/cholesterol/gamma-HCH transport system permease protein
MGAPGELALQQPSDDTLMAVLSGPWKLGQPLPSADVVQQKLESTPAIRQIEFDATQLADWDSGLLTFLMNLRHFCEQKQIRLDSSGLPDGARQLIALATAVPPKKDARQAEKRMPFLAHVGDDAIAFIRSFGDMLSFIGDVTIAFIRLLQGKAQYRRSDLWLTVESCGGQALSIVTLISFLVGLILAFIGAIQLKLFGAEIYVANLVGIAMVRLMASIMTGIVMAGRTGGAFAAQLGTMQVNQEIDALKTLGISPMEFLVLPRMLALALMMPLLSLYANVVGILGGMLVGGHAGFELRAVLPPDGRCRQDVGPLDRSVLQRGVWGDCGPGRLHAGHGMRPQCLGRGRCGHLGRGDCHCGDHCGHGPDHHCVQCVGDLARKRPFITKNPLIR